MQVTVVDWTAKPNDVVWLRLALPGGLSTELVLHPTHPITLDELKQAIKEAIVRHQAANERIGILAGYRPGDVIEVEVTDVVT